MKTVVLAAIFAVPAIVLAGGDVSAATIVAHDRAPKVITRTQVVYRTRTVIQRRTRTVKRTVTLAFRGHGGQAPR